MTHILPQRNRKFGWTSVVNKAIQAYTSYAMGPPQVAFCVVCYDVCFQIPDSDIVAVYINMVSCI